MKIMFVGTSSNAGKTFVSALFCRYLRSKMIMVTPFKAFNLSSITYRTDDGKEMGVGQALQAWASDIRPNARMNPIVMKATDNGLELILDGSPSGALGRQALLSHALDAFDRLSDLYDAVVAEGSGSPAEINLKENDIANTALATARSIPMILIGDIEKGGVFAGIYGTWRLMNDDERKLMKGFIINKYYGDPAVLKSGIERIEKMTGMKCFGILPYMNVNIPEEDTYEGGNDHSAGRMDAFVAALDEILVTLSGSIDMEGILKAAE
ncbi:MAG: AAA family ATPase [Methanomassiliicoccaceae archaeon]|nr:AAA family ATPase [Methanomassiliicoccaceae archaeon]